MNKIINEPANADSFCFYLRLKLDEIKPEKLERESKNKNGILFLFIQSGHPALI